MNVRDCFLDDENVFQVGGTTIGAMIASAGKRRLWEPRNDGRVDVAVIHYISAVNVAPNDPYNISRIFKIFCDYAVSSHYLISRDGEIFRLVPEECKAWHAGASIMPEPDNRNGVNEFSIGIELVATDVSGFTAAQYDSLNHICAGIEARYGANNMKYVGHDQIAGERAVALGLRKEPKTDPGPLFDWDRFTERLRRRRDFA